MSAYNDMTDDPFGDNFNAAPPAAAPLPAQGFTPPVPQSAPVAPAETVSEVAGEDVQIPRGGPVAGGRREPISPAKPLPAWEDPSGQDLNDGADGDIDYSDLVAINRDLQRLRARTNRVRREMRRAGREALEAKLTYQRALRRALVQQTGGSAESRKASAELMCEELEADMMMKQQVADEYSTLFRSVRDDVENAKVVAYNLRAIQSIV
jgi:hypothetical protein